MNDDHFLDVINKAREAQTMLAPCLGLHQDLAYANIQFQMAIRLIEDAMAQMSDEASGAMTIVLTPTTH